MPNLYGGILTNIASGITGGPGLTPGANIGDKFTLFESGTRHRGQDLVGKDCCNPTAILLTAAMMLRRLNFPHFADALETGLYRTILNCKTPDIGGEFSTTEFVEKLIDNL